jgi:hypothetical protein
MKSVRVVLMFGLQEILKNNRSISSDDIRNNESVKLLGIKWAVYITNEALKAAATNGLQVNSCN